MLKIPQSPTAAAEWAKDIADECMASSDDRAQVSVRASQYYWTGSADANAAIHNKIKPLVKRLAGYYYQPYTVRFNTVFDANEPQDVLERGKTVSTCLTADYRANDADLRFGDAVLWGLINGCYLLKHIGDGLSFRVAPVHPVNFGVYAESIVSLDEQEAFCHVSYPSVSRLRTILAEMNHPERSKILDQIEERAGNPDAQEPNYFHQIVVGGLNPLGPVGGVPEAAGMVQVFPTPTPWRPQRRLQPTVKLCELWVKNRDFGGAYTTMQLVWPDILIEGSNTRRNIMGGQILAHHHPFVKVEAEEVPGYFWGRPIIADVQMLQDMVSKRLRDLKVIWDRNAAAPYTFSGFQSITEEQYYKIISEGGFIADPNPNAKAQKLTEPPTPGYLEELEFVWKMFDETVGFTPVLTGQGDPGVRAGVHAQTLVRTSSPGMIDPATRIERALADSGFLCTKLMQDRDPRVYTTEGGVEFKLIQLPDRFQMEVDSHSASPAFAEDSRQIAIALARAGVLSGEDLIEMVHPPNAELLLARLRQRQQAQAKAAQEAEARGQPPPGANGQGHPHSGRQAPQKH